MITSNLHICGADCRSGSASRGYSISSLLGTPFEAHEQAEACASHLHLCRPHVSRLHCYGIASDPDMRHGVPV